MLSLETVATAIGGWGGGEAKGIIKSRDKKKECIDETLIAEQRDLMIRSQLTGTLQAVEPLTTFFVSRLPQQQ